LKDFKWLENIHTNQALGPVACWEGLSLTDTVAWATPVRAALSGNL